MALAEITYNAGISCQIGSTRFHLNRAVLVKDSNIIARAQSTRGFSVHVIQRTKKTRKVLRTVDGETRRAAKRSKRSDS